eukprot:8942631-Pyramimonas_sp.AAC.1
MRWSPLHPAHDEESAFQGLGRRGGVAHRKGVDPSGSLAGEVPPALPFVSVLSASSGGSALLAGPPVGVGPRVPT